jgi:hypothetical protein
MQHPVIACGNMVMDCRWWAQWREDNHQNDMFSKLSRLPRPIHVLSDMPSFLTSSVPGDVALLS